MNKGIYVFENVPYLLLKYCELSVTYLYTGDVKIFELYECLFPSNSTIIKYYYQIENGYTDLEYKIKIHIEQISIDFFIKKLRKGSIQVRILEEKNYLEVGDKNDK